MRIASPIPLLLIALCTASSAPAATVDPDAEGGLLKAFIVSGANNHDWRYTTPQLTELLEASGKFEVKATFDPGEHLAAEGALDDVDVIVLDYNGPRWGEKAEANFLAAVRGGVGVAVIHAANNAFPGWVEYETLVGDLWRRGTGHGRFHAFDVTITDRDHPITADLANLTAHPDELYHRLVHMHGAEKRVLATAFSSKESGGTGEAELMITVGTVGKGRIFHTPLAHVWKDAKDTHASYADPQLRDLIVRGAEWAATGKVTTQAAPVNGLSAREKEQGWRLLFDGATLEGWRGYRTESAPAGWKVERGEITVKAGGAGGDLMTDASFGDFEFDFEFQVSPGANSGVIYRVIEEGKASYMSGPEFQVLDDPGVEYPKNSPHSVGALYGLAAPPKTKVVRIVGGWNRGRVRVEGWAVTHWLNGYEVCALDLGSEDGRRLIAESKFSKWPQFATAARGHLALQDHGNVVRYRSLKIRELDSP